MRKAFSTSVAALALGAIMALSGCNVIRGESTAGEYVDDVTITTKVKAELVDSGKVDASDVNVDVNKGRVTLSGWATTQEERTRAAQLAGAVSGVKSVDNRIKIKT
jgi:hyperosmotically inducible periplasmic protein